MAVFLSNLTVVTLNSVVLTTRTASCTLRWGFDSLPVTAMGDVIAKVTKGLENSDVTFSFFNDDIASGAGSVRATLNGAVGSTVTLTLKQSSAATSTTNPLYSTSIFIHEVTPINGSPDSLSQQEHTYVCNEPVVMTTI